MGHLGFLKAKQQMNPNGGRTMVKRMPREVRSPPKPDSADRAASNDNNGIGRLSGDISTVDVGDPGVVGGCPCDRVSVGRRGGGTVATRAAGEVALAGVQVAGARALLQQVLAVLGPRCPARRPPGLPLPRRLRLAALPLPVCFFKKIKSTPKETTWKHFGS